MARQPVTVGRLKANRTPPVRPSTKARSNKPAGSETIKLPDIGGNIEVLRILAAPYRERTAVLNEVLIEINWTEEAYQLASVEADIVVKNNGGFAKDVLKPGTWLQIQFFDMFHRKWLNIDPQLYVWDRAQTDDVAREARVHAFDISSFLHNQDTQDWFFKKDKKHKEGWTAYEIARTVLMDLEVPSRLAKTKYKIPWLYMQEHTPFEAILKAYTRDRQITGVRWRIQAENRKVTVMPFTKQNKVWVITAGSNLISAEWTESLNTRKTEVIVLATAPKTGKTRGARATSAKVREFGRIREVIYLEKNINSAQLKSFAREALRYVDRFETTVRVTSEGLAPLRAGDAVYISDKKGTGLDGRFFITEITHNFTASGHSMDLGLSEISIVPTLYPSRDELVSGITSVNSVGPVGSQPPATSGATTPNPSTESSPGVVGGAMQQALANRIDSLLKEYNSVLEGLGNDFVSVAAQFNISAEYLVALAAAESTFARDSSAQRSNNPFGMLVAGPGTPLRTYPSYQQAMVAVGRTLTPNRSDSQYEGRHTASDVYVRYCGDCPNGQATIKLIMQKLGASPNMRVR